jgi:hypothetical protein
VSSDVSKIARLRKHATVNKLTIYPIVPDYTTILREKNKNTHELFVLNIDTITRLGLYITVDEVSRFTGAKTYK